jgi:hypothetical protein
MRCVGGIDCEMSVLIRRFLVCPRKVTACVEGETTLIGVEYGHGRVSTLQQTYLRKCRKTFRIWPKKICVALVPSTQGQSARGEGDSTSGHSGLFLRSPVLIGTLEFS